MELPAVELDDEPLLREVGVDLVAADDGVELRNGKSVAVTQSSEQVLEVRAPGSLAGQHEPAQRLGRRVGRVALAQIGDLSRRGEPGDAGVVDGARQNPCGKRGRAVEERPGGAGDPDAALDGQVAAMKGAGAVDGDAPGAAVASCQDHLERRGPALREPPERKGGAVAEPGVPAAGQDGGGRPFQVHDRGSADCVDAVVDPMEATERHSMSDRLAAKAERPELGLGDVAVLALSDSGNRPIEGLG